MSEPQCSGAKLCKLRGEERTVGGGAAEQCLIPLPPLIQRHLRFLDVFC